METRIARIRSFNRMYMHRIGMLAERIFGSNFSLAEIRVLNELSFRGTMTAKELCTDLRMDGGYLSRILSGFEKKGLITREKSKRDARQRRIILTRKGKKAGDGVLAEAKKKIIALLAVVSLEDQIRMVSAMDTIDEIINSNLVE